MLFFLKYSYLVVEGAHGHKWYVSYLNVCRIFLRFMVILVWTKMQEDKCGKTFVCLGCWGNVLTIFQGFVFSSWLMKSDIESVYMTVLQQEKCKLKKNNNTILRIKWQRLGSGFLGYKDRLWAAVSVTNTWLLSNKVPANY